MWGGMGAEVGRSDPAAEPPSGQQPAHFPLICRLAMELSVVGGTFLVDEGLHRVSTLIKSSEAPPCVKTGTGIFRPVTLTARF